MTLEEKVAQLQNDAPAIPRLDVPAYEWWNEALHGVARAGAATVFPQAIGLAATFDVPLMTQVATVISDEGRAKHHDFASRGQRKRYQGLTFWSPNINIFRDPRWGRGQETYGEDPFLTSRMGVAFVKALQGDDPKYRKVDATAKHYAVHSGPEHNRHVFDVHPSERDLWETYLPQGELTQATALGTDDYSIRWTGKLLPPASGKYELVVGANDGFRLYVDGKVVSDGWEPNQRVTSKSAFVDLEGGKAYDLKLEYFEADRDAEVRLAWRLPGAKPPFDEAMDAARAADVVIFVGGLTGDVEGEEMRVNFPGFTGGDRTDLLLPQSQQKLLDALQATGKPVILVLTAGSAIAVDREQAKLPAILMAWYPGQRGGNAVADVLFGVDESCGTAARHLLQGRRKASGLRGLQHEEPDLPVLRRRSRCIPSAMASRTRSFTYSRPEARQELRGGGRQRAGHGHGQERRQPRR